MEENREEPELMPGRLTGWMGSSSSRKSRRRLTVAVTVLHTVLEGDVQRERAEKKLKRKDSEYEEGKEGKLCNLNGERERSRGKGDSEGEA